MSAIVLAPSVMVDGVQWSLFAVEFNTADGKFSTYLYAIDHGHAAMILEDLKETAAITGQVCGAIKGRHA